MITIQSQANVAEIITLNYEQVVAVRSFDHNGYVVIAVLTGPIFSQRERIDLVKSIKTMVAEQLSISIDNVVVSYDMELFRAMDSIDDEDRRWLVHQFARSSLD